MQLQLFLIWLRRCLLKTFTGKVIYHKCCFLMSNKFLWKINKISYYSYQSKYLSDHCEIHKNASKQTKAYDSSKRINIIKSMKDLPKNFSLSLLTVYHWTQITYTLADIKIMHYTCDKSMHYHIPRSLRVGRYLVRDWSVIGIKKRWESGP